MPNNLKPPYGQIYVRVYYKGQLIPGEISDFKYTYAEDDSDGCWFDIKFLPLNAPDLPMFQEKTRLDVIWGYVKGPKTKRAIFINDVDWVYDDEYVTAMIDASDKAVSTKQSSSNTLHSDANLLGIANTIAKKHGLKSYIGVEVSDADNPNPNIILTEAEKKGKNFIEIIKLTEQKRKNLKKIIYFEAIDAQKHMDYLKAKDSARDKFRSNSTVGFLLPTKQDFNTLPSNIIGKKMDLLKEVLNSFKSSMDIPQANKSDLQLLKDQAMKQGDEYLIESRDDAIYLHMRNFNQAPYKSYIWHGGTGELIDFRPRTNNKGRKGTSVNMQFTGWDKENKQFFSGDANTLNDKTRNTLSKYEEDLASLKDDPDNKIVGRTYSNKFLATVTGYSMGGGTDKTVTNLKIFIPITALDRKNLLNATLDAFGGHNKPLHDPTAGSPEDAFNNASNLRNNSALKKHHGSFKMTGDPGMKCGILITVLGLAKKHAGNYYVYKVTHHVTKDGGYIIDGEVIRKGHNIRPNNNYTAARAVGKNVNANLGPAEGTTPSKQLPLKTNIR